MENCEMIAALLVGLLAMDPATCPMHAQHTAPKTDAAHAADVNHRHDSFGFSHEATTHNFRLLRDGGAIELRANDAGDQARVDAIRAHLREVAAEFGKGDYAKALFVHGHEPAGVAELKQSQDKLRYRFEEVPGGGRVRIQAGDDASLYAVHEFMKFQIAEHHTADSGKVESEK
jgi:hypothetical protein